MAGGQNLRDVARRTDDTLSLFGAFFRWGHSSARGRAAIARMEQIHARFAITDEQKRYTLATLIFEAERIGQHLGFDPFTANQREASWRFWRGVAEQMPLGGLPPTAGELWRWMIEYEREHWHYTAEGRLVSTDSSRTGQRAGFHVGTDVVEPDDAVHPTPLDRRLALQLHTQLDEERFGSLEVLDNDENVVHPLNRHISRA